MTTPLITIEARRGKAAFVDRGQHVVDTWAFNRHDLTEFMSMEHSRTALQRIMAPTGASMVMNHRRPLLTLVEDTTPGIHDTLLAAVRRHRPPLVWEVERPENRPFDEGLDRVSHDLVEWDEYPTFKGGEISFSGRLLGDAILSHDVGTDGFNKLPNFSLRRACVPSDSPCS